VLGAPRSTAPSFGAYRPVCGRSVEGLTGALTGTKRVSLLPEVGALDARKMASNRNMKISDSMFMLPGSTM